MDLQQEEVRIPEGLSGICEHPGKRTTERNRRQRAAGERGRRDRGEIRPEDISDHQEPCRPDDERAPVRSEQDLREAREHREQCDSAEGVDQDRTEEGRGL
eukprot:12156041-Heterocapsa_arctica.AAC.1